MKAAVVEKLGSVTVKQVPVPEVKDGSVLLKVLSCAICGSDVRIFHHGNDRVTFPAILGHEMVGEVVETGKGVTTYRKGDRVAVGADVPCGECDWCRNDMGNCCDENHAMGYQFQGGFAQYCLLEPMVIKYGPVCVVPETLSSEEGSIAEPLACCINAYERMNYEPGKSVLVFGAGPVGILLIKLARTMNAATTILVDTSKNRLNMATLAKADVLVDGAHENVKERALDITKGRGVDYILTACPSPEAHEQAIDIVAKRGCVNLFGGLPAGTRNIEISSNTIHYKESVVTGSHGAVPRHHASAVDMLAKKKINIEGLISHRFHIDEILRAFDMVKKQEGLKIVINSFD